LKNKQLISDNGSQGNLSAQSAGSNPLALGGASNESDGSLKEMQYRQSLRSFNECQSKIH
jgi:hypothetical protein